LRWRQVTTRSVYVSAEIVHYNESSMVRQAQRMFAANASPRSGYNNNSSCT